MPSLPSQPRRSGVSRTGGPPVPRLPPANRSELVRHWMTRTFSGRAVVGGVAVKVVAFVLGLFTGPTTLVQVIDTCGDLAIIIGALIVFVLLSADMKQRLLWRIRRKLAVSYIFMGFVPALLIITFFLVAGLLLFINISGYLVREQLQQIVDQVGFVAQSAADGILRARDADRVRNVLEARVATLSSRYAGASIGIAPSTKTCGQTSDALPALEPLFAGPWRHAPAPRAVPAWISCDGYIGITTYIDGGREFATVRAAVWLSGTSQVVVVDVPVDGDIARAIRDRPGAALEGLSMSSSDDSIGEVPAGIVDPIRRPVVVTWSDADRGGASPTGQPGVATIDVRDWETGAEHTLFVGFRMRVGQVYTHITSGSPLSGEITFGQALPIALTLIGVMFLIIQVVAFAMGLALARSITGSVHELAEGTERVRRGDFTGRVSIMSRDQLGELS